MKIQRTALFFKDGYDTLVRLNDWSDPLSLLFNRLMNEVYAGKGIKFFNICLDTEKTYLYYPKATKYYMHNYGEVISYSDVFDLESFENLSREERRYFLWRKMYDVVLEASVKTKFKELAEAADYAYLTGIARKLDPDYRVLEKDVILYGTNLKAAVWITFDDLNMYSKFTLERNCVIIYEKQIDTTRLGVSFFLEIYKKIELSENTIIIKGPGAVDYFPLKIKIEPEVVENIF